MSKQHIRHYSVKRNGRGFWQPTPTMRLHGFCSIPCGPDGPDAWAIAELWNSRWDATRRGEAPSPAHARTDNLSTDQLEALTIYPRRSVGAAFQEFRATEEWSNDSKAPRTREDWWRVWKRIKPVFADCDPRTVTFDDDLGVAAGDRGNRVASRGAPLPQNLARLWKVIGRARLLRPRCRPVARRAQHAPPRDVRRPGPRARSCACSRAHGGSSITASRRSSPWHGRRNSRRAMCAP